MKSIHIVAVVLIVAIAAVVVYSMKKDETIGDKIDNTVENVGDSIEESTDQ